MRIVITRSWSVYHIDEKKKKIACKKRGLDRYYNRFRRKPTVLTVG